jgi:hypothetical protein
VRRGFAAPAGRIAHRYRLPAVTIWRLRPGRGPAFVAAKPLASREADRRGDSSEDFEVSTPPRTLGIDQPDGPGGGRATPIVAATLTEAEDADSREDLVLSFFKRMRDQRPARGTTKPAEPPANPKFPGTRHPGASRRGAEMMSEDAKFALGF